jgi:DNA-binding LytR/AlgR family response regulator
VNDTLLQSTLRELKVFSASPRFWITFAAVVLLFAVTGPFETSARLPLAARFGYWFVIHACAWSITILFVILGNLLLETVLDGMFLRMVIGAAIAAFPVGGVILATSHSWFGEALTWSNYAAEVGTTLPLNLILCGITYMTMSNQTESTEPVAGFPQTASAAAEPAEAKSPAPILARLKPDNRGALLHLSVSDHYTLVTTSRGRELILLRFSDAMRETGSVEGLQVHRSHWVARDHIAAINRTSSRTSLTLKDGTEIPVSRTYSGRVRTLL